MITTKIIKLTKLKNRLDKEKRIIDRKLSIINNLINTSMMGCSSAGKSDGLLTRESEVRILLPQNEDR